MRKGLLAIITTLFFIGVSGQGLDWMIKSGSVSVPDNNIIVDESGNTYLVAGALTELDVDPSNNIEVVSLSGNGGQTAFLVKYDSQGGFLWVRSMRSTVGSYVSNFSVDDNGNCYVSGHFEGSIDFDSNISTDNLTDYNLYGSGFLAKYDSDGDFLWSEVADGKVKAISSNEFLLFGGYDSSTDFDFGNGMHFESVFDSIGGVYVAKYDGLANLISVKTISDGEARYVKWADEKNGETYLCGHGFTYDSVMIDSNLWGLSRSDFFVSKYDAGGSLVWKRDVGSGGSDGLTSYELDDLGNVYVAGNFQNTVDFNPGGVSVNLTSIGNKDMFLAKYDPAGINEWVYNISDQQDTSTSPNQGGWPKNMILSMTYDSQEGVLISGQQGAELEVNHSGGMALLSDVNGRGAFVMNFDDSGYYNFGKTISGINGPDVHAHGVATDNNGNFYLSGHFSGLVDFDLEEGVQNNYSSHGLFLAKYSFNTVGINENELGSDFSLYPNPASNNINIEFDSQEPLVNLQIVNVHGQQVFVEKYQNTESIELNIEGFNAGFYFARVATHDGQRSIKFIKK